MQASFTTPDTVPTNTSLSVQNHSSYASSCIWNWGDGSTSTGTSPSHSYRLTGKYRVHLQATGIGGVDTTSRLVQVMAGLPPAAVAGRYRGRFTFRSFSMCCGGTTWTRDTTLQLTVVNPNYARFDVFHIPYRPVAYGGLPYYWKPGSPQTAEFFEVDGALNPRRRAYLYIKHADDSIRYWSTSGGQGGGSEHKFIAKKLP